MSIGFKVGLMRAPAMVGLRWGGMARLFATGSWYAVVSSVIILAAGPPVMAQDDSATDVPETLLGIIETPPDRLVPQSAPEDPRSADALYAAGMSELQAAHFDEARRLFELFVVRDPQHPSVPEARRHLSELYQLDTQAGPGPEPAETAAMPEPALPTAPVARIVSTPRSVGGRLEESFMLDAGDRVFFAARSAELGSRARTVLAAQARWMKRNSSLSAVIEGHADDPALDGDGLDRLGTERALAVYQRLIEEGVAPERLAIAPQGKSRPVANCDTPDCAAQNRRAVTVLTGQRVSELPVAEPLIGPRRP
jgi:outer membrane protein OmpA-like peptidoglycan-associated protein